jgi:Mg/Co/Ni transporter MgtE
MLKEMHPADIADIVEDIPEDQRVWFIEHLPSEVIADVLEEIEPIYQAGIIEGLNSEKARDVIANLEPDKAADIISNLSDSSARKVFSYMDREEAKEVEELLQHPKRRAGGLMTTEYISFPPDMSVGEAIEKFKEQAEEIETVYYIYITEGDILKGVLSLRELLLADRNKKLSEIMTTNIKFCTPDMHYKEIAEIMATYNLIALPVIEDGKLKGIVTVDDILEIVFPPP